MPPGKRKNKSKARPEPQPKLPRLDDSVRVAKPALPLLASAAPQTRKFRSELTTNEIIFKQSARRASQYMSTAPVFRAPTSLSQLQSRPKNIERDIQMAQEKAERLADRPTRYSSARWVDENGVPLAFYLSSRLRNGGVVADGVVADEDEDGAVASDEGDNSEGEGGEEVDDEEDQADGTEAAKNEIVEEPDAEALNRSRPLEEQHSHNETFQDFYSTHPHQAVRDGLMPQMCQRMLEVTQTLASFCQPEFNPRDIRHQPKEEEHQEGQALDPRLFYSDIPTTISELPVPSDFPVNECRPGVEVASQVEGAERRGTIHLVHLWEAQAHPAEKYGMTPSVDMTGKSCTQSQATEWYFFASAHVAQILAGIFSVCFPKFYGLYRKAFDAGVWYTSDPGPWLGRAVVFKLQVYPHRDGLDAGPSASFPVGFFTGGEALLLDLDAKLAYQPGDILIFMSGALYHRVSEWFPAPVPADLAAQGITAGRVSTVFFFPQASLQSLEGKPPLWGKRTMGGKIYDALDFSHARAQSARKAGREQRPGRN